MKYWIIIYPVLSVGGDAGEHVRGAWPSEPQTQLAVLTSCSLLALILKGFNEAEKASLESRMFGILFFKILNQCSRTPVAYSYQW